jgi:tetratricopeptide (TPR) repeat protein
MISGLEEAAGARIILESADGRYRFSHALVRDTVYDSLSSIRRDAMHARVATTLETLHGAGAGSRVAEIAGHWLASRQPDARRAIETARSAGDTALARLAPEEAISWYGRALDLAMGQATVEPADRVDLVLGLGQAQLFAGEPAHRETLLRAAHLAEEAGDGERLVRAALANTRGTHSRTGWVDEEKVAVLEAALAASPQDSAARSLLLAMQAVELLFADDDGRCRQLADEALALARRLEDRSTLVSVANTVYLAVSVPDTLDQRLAMTAETVRLAEGQGDPSAYHFACRFRCYACADRGDIDGFERYLDEASRAAERAGEPSLRWVAGFVRSCRLLLAGDVAEAERVATEAFELGAHSGQPDALPIFVGGLIEIRRHQDRLVELEPMLVRAVDENPGLPLLRTKLAALYCDIGNLDAAGALFGADLARGFTNLRYDLTWLTATTTYAEVAARLGDSAAAAQLYDRLTPWHDQMAFIYYASGGAVAHCLAMLATVLGAYEAAEAHFREAVGIHTRLRSPYWIASTQIEWSRLLLRRRHPTDADRAREMLGEALAGAREFGLAKVERDAVVLLGDCD